MEKETKEKEEREEEKREENGRSRENRRQSGRGEPNRNRADKGGGEPDKSKADKDGAGRRERICSAGRILAPMLGMVLGIAAVVGIGIWGVSIVCLIAGLVLGVLTF